MSVARDGRIVIVGGGLAAARGCEQLRREGFEGSLTVAAAEPHPPYDRPPLSKEVLLGTRDESALRFDPAALTVDLRLGTPATGVDIAERVVRTADGGLPYDGLVLATGATPVRLPGDGEQLTLRTVDDALALRSRLQPGARVVLIGASWIGAEVATAALARGCHVGCVEAGPAPLAQALGTEIGESLLPWWHDVELHLETKVRAVTDGAVALADGSELPADVVVVGVGVRPETGWLASSGLELDRGVVVDEHLRASAPGVVAVGDVAARWSPRWQTWLRVEHWDDAVMAPAVAAKTLLQPDGEPLPVHDPVPYFWSDQFGHKVQYVGHFTAADRMVWRGTDGEGPVNRGRAAAWIDPHGRLTALLALDRPKDVAQARRAIAAGAAPALDRLTDPAVPVRDTVE